MTSFFMSIPVKAVPGSNQKKAFYNPHTGRSHITDKAKNRSEFIAILRLHAAKKAEELGWDPFEGPVAASYRFFYARPKSHYGTGRNAGIVKESAPERHTQKPDIDNLIKTTKDSLKGIVWRDDSQVAEIDAVKFWAEKNSVEITVMKLEG